jgi:hypothetical protein
LTHPAAPDIVGIVPTKKGQIMFGRKKEEPRNDLVSAIRVKSESFYQQYNDKIMSAADIPAIDRVRNEIEADKSMISEQAYVLLCREYYSRRQTLAALMMSGPGTAPASVEDTRDLFTRNLDSMAKMLANWQKRREYLEGEILRLSEELYQVNVSTEAVKTAQQMIIDHQAVKHDEVLTETSKFETESEAMFTAVTDVLADVAQGSAAYDDPDVISKLEEAVVTANLTGRRANHKAPADASAK